MFLQNLICSQGYEMRQFYENETFIITEFNGCKDNNLNMNSKLIRSILCNRLEAHVCLQNKPVKNSQFLFYHFAADL